MIIVGQKSRQWLDIASIDVDGDHLKSPLFGGRGKFERSAHHILFNRHFDHLVEGGVAALFDEIPSPNGAVIADFDPNLCRQLLEL